MVFNKTSNHLEKFLDLYYRPHGFQVVKFVQTSDVTQSVESAVKEMPLGEFTIPARGPMLHAVGLGLMLAFALAAGIVPTPMGWN